MICTDPSARNGSAPVQVPAQGSVQCPVPNRDEIAWHMLLEIPATEIAAIMVELPREALRPIAWDVVARWVDLQRRDEAPPPPRPTEALRQELAKQSAEPIAITNWDETREQRTDALPIVAVMRALESVGAIKMPALVALSGFSKSTVHASLQSLRGQGRAFKSVSAPTFTYWSTSQSTADEAAKKEQADAALAAFRRSALVRLPVVIDQITSIEDRFFCEPYRATISARTCIERQRAMRGERGPSERWGKAAQSTKPMFHHCRDCADGRRVEQLAKEGS